LAGQGDLVQGGLTVYKNITLKDNRFLSPSFIIGREDQNGGYVSHNSFVHIGAVDGLTVTGNRMTRSSPLDAKTADADMRLYSNRHVQTSANLCFNANSHKQSESDEIPCITSNKPFKTDDGAAGSVRVPHVLFIVADGKYSH
jgi:hypothetical protein